MTVLIEKGKTFAQQRVYAPLLAEAAPVLGFRAILVRGPGAPPHIKI